MIRHSALFRLKHADGSAEEADFLGAQRLLADIPGVEDFQLWRETSPKNDFAFAVSMSFAGQAAYDAYNAHPIHTAFVQERWIPEVEDFLEHDAVLLS